MTTTLPHITKKQQEILLLLYRFRFLNRPQIQTMLHHKNTRRVNEWLPDLVKKQYVGRILDTKHAIHNIPEKYYITVNGIRFLKTQPDCEQGYINRFYTDDEKTEGFITQSILIADCYLDLLEKYANNPGFQFYTRSDYSIDGLMKKIFPYFVFRREDEEPFYVVEIFHETAPRKWAIIPRMTEYIQFFTQEEWLQREPLPKLLIICPNKKKQNTIRREAKVILREEDISDFSIYTTLQDQIKGQRITGDVWQQVEQD